MPSPRLRRLLATVVLSFVGTAVFAAGPTFWQVSTEADLLRGEVENLSIDQYGRLTLGPVSTQIYESPAPFLWTIAQGPDGASYIGSGNEGQVLRVDATGASRVFFDADELEVHALAFGGDGTLYVGTSPDGRIYKVTPAGVSSIFFDPADRYIWSLAIDRAGNVFAATGDKGVVYRITPDGRGTAFYQTKATHAMSLAFDAQGRLIVGSESPARVFQVDANGRGFVLLDTPYTEIHALRLDGRGNVWAVAVGGRSATAGAAAAPAADTGGGGGGGGTPVITVSTEISAIVVADPGPAPAPQAAPARAGTGSGAVYRISPEGVSDAVWESREDAPYDVAFDADASVFVATGNRGKVYRLSGDPLQPALVARTTTQQVTALARDRAGQTLFVTANPGRLYRLSQTRADRGTFTSDVRDAQNVASWGTIRWQALATNGARVEISTRSGNTRTPDEGWSDWSAAYPTPDGSTISSPRARFLQWRAVLVGGRGDAPLLTSVVAAYLPRNIRPKVTSITINPPGTVYQQPFPTDPPIQGFAGDPLDRRFAAQTAGTATGATPSLGRRAYQKGLLTFVWRAEDDNRDDLRYDVLFRREGDTVWRTLKKGLDEAILAWDTTSVANGRYVLRIVASDAASNSPATALTGSLDSATFDIDNTPPAIAVTGSRRDGARTVLLFEVRDADSSVQRVEYSTDGDTWIAVYPVDGIADSRLERFELALDAELATRGVVIRATDALNNIGNVRGEAPQQAPSGGR